MNENALIARFALIAALLLGACSPAGGDGPPLQGARIGGPFTLTDQNGRQVSDRQFNGQYRLMYFGFTFCPDVCPVDLQIIGQAMRILEKDSPDIARKIQPIFITVDPERDRPAVLKPYVSAFHPRLIGLTGTPEQIATVAKSFGVYFSKADQAGSTSYLVDHSRIALLFGPEGEPIAILPQEEGAEAVAAELKRWVR